MHREDAGKCALMAPVSPLRKSVSPSPLSSGLDGLVFTAKSLHNEHHKTSEYLWMNIDTIEGVCAGGLDPPCESSLLAAMGC